MAGGTGSRLGPLTLVTNKHLLPVYDKPMIYYPLSTLMLAGIRDIMVITNEDDVHFFMDLMLDGSQWGLHIEYAIQIGPRGIADAFHIASGFIGDQRCAIILGDNVFYGAELGEIIKEPKGPAVIFCQQVNDPGRYGVVEFSDGLPISIEEKPSQPKSNWAVTGLYIYDPSVVDIAKTLQPSARGEYEITDVNRIYMEKRCLTACKLGRGFAWFDAGTPQSLLQASEFIYTLQERQGLKIGDPSDIVGKSTG